MVRMFRVVTLFGKVLEPEKWLPFYVIDVLPDLGDAKEFGLAGQVRIHRRQLAGEPHLDPGSNGKDIVRVPEHVARSVGKPSTSERKRKQ